MRRRISNALARLSGWSPVGAPFEVSRLSAAGRSANQQRIRAQSASAYVGGGNALCRVLGRYKMYVDTRDVGLSSHLLLDGFWEMWTTEVIARRVKPGMVVADVGANLGYFSVLMADLVGPRGRLHAFEPNPAMAERLRRNLVVNGFAARGQVHPSPLSGRDGDVVKLVVHPEFPSAAYIQPGPAAREEGLQLGALNTRRFDSFPDLAAVDFVKIDAEGAEEAIWEGMGGVLAAGRPLTVILEFSPTRYADPRAFLDAISAYGFSLALIDPATGERLATPDQVLAHAQPEERMLLLCR